MRKKELMELIEEAKTQFKSSYEEEFGGVATITPVLERVNTVVTFYISVKGDHRHFEDAIRLETAYPQKIKDYSKAYARLYHKTIREREWSKRR